MSGDQVWGGYTAVPTVEDAVACFRELLNIPGPRTSAIHERLPKLRGHNLACWCKVDARWCHADVLLELANAP